MAEMHVNLKVDFSKVDAELERLQAELYQLGQTKEGRKKVRAVKRRGKRKLKALTAEAMAEAKAHFKEKS